jgi:hypothetical protein
MDRLVNIVCACVCTLAKPAENPRRGKETESKTRARILILDGKLAYACMYTTLVVALGQRIPLRSFVQDHGVGHGA